MALLPCRLLPYAIAEGAVNMAADEVLLQAAASSGVAALRFYGWSTATLSLGYFQAAADRLADARLTALPWVRRPSGGEALVHDQELTYALALPPGLPWQRRGESWPRRIHELVRAALNELGISSRLSETETRLGEFLCFLHSTPADLLIGDTKIAGSAQRKRHGALLQHGGILLAASPAAPELPGIAEVTGQRIGAVELAELMQKKLAKEASWDVAAGFWAPAELAQIEELAAARYRSLAWQEKR